MVWARNMPSQLTMTCCVPQIFAEPNDIDFSKPEHKPNKLLTMNMICSQSSCRVGFSAAKLAVNIISLGSSQQNRTTHSVPRSWFFYLFSNKRDQGFLEKWLILGLGQEVRKMISLG